MLSGKKIVLGITGSIAAYKIPQLVRDLVREGVEIRVVMTAAAGDFVSRLTLGTLSRNPVLTDLFDDDTWANHVQLGRWADLMLIAPLSCNTLSKMASGQCDNLLLATYLSATCPVMVAPAMDEDMWHHPSTRSNLDTLRRYGCRVMKVGYGELASGLIGEGRMAEPAEIVEEIRGFFKTAGQLSGKKALVTAGPTHESIDPVRFIGNHSTGKMGYAIAEELAARGAAVTLVSGPVALKPQHPGIRLVSVTSAQQMFEACAGQEYDIAVLAAAVADYTPVTVAGQKIKKKDEGLTLELRKTRDILASLGAEKKEGQVLVGFALETEKEEAHALKKLEAKKADIIVLNSLRDEGAGFGHDTNKATLFFRNGSRREVELKSKSGLAKDIVDSITDMI